MVPAVLHIRITGETSTKKGKQDRFLSNIGFYISAMPSFDDDSPDHGETSVAQCVTTKYAPANDVFREISWSK